MSANPINGYKIKVLERALPQVDKELSISFQTRLLSNLKEDYNLLLV